MLFFDRDFLVSNGRPTVKSYRLIFLYQSRKLKAIFKTFCNSSHLFFNVSFDDNLSRHHFSALIVFSAKKTVLLEGRE